MLIPVKRVLQKLEACLEVLTSLKVTGRAEKYQKHGVTLKKVLIKTF